MTKGVAGGRFVTLDGMRGVAALIVLVSHSPQLFTSVPGSGYLAVDLFFALSGFVIAGAYDARIERGLTVRSFMAIRLIRLYPMYILGIAISTFLFLLVTPSSGDRGLTPTLATQIGYSVFMLPTPPLQRDWLLLYPLNGAAWSLFLELLANLVFVVFWRFLTIRNLLAVAALFALMFLWSIPKFGAANTGAEWSNLLGGIPRVGYAFTIGIILARTFPRLSNLPRFNPLVPLGLTVLILSISPPAGYRVAFDLACVLVVLPALLTLGALATSSRIDGVQAELGRASYGVYATHVPLLLAVKVTLDHLRVDFGITSATLAPWSGIAFAIGVFVFALFADRLFDVPFRKRLTTMLFPAAGKTVV